MTVKYSPKMLRDLRNLHAPTSSDAEPEGVKGSYWININTAVALMSRGAVVHITPTRIGITRVGAEAVDIDYDAMIERAHEQALKDAASFRRCPFADTTDCDFTAFGSPGTPFGHYRDVTSDDQLLWHVGQSHMPFSSRPGALNIVRMTDEHRATVREFIASYEQKLAYVAPADDESAGEARERRERLAERDHEEQVHSGDLCDCKRIDDVEEARTAARYEYIERAKTTPGEHSLMTTISKTPTYAVDIPLRGAYHCERDDAHTPHVWSHLGPEPTWYCDGTFQHVPESRALPELHGPIVDDHGDDVAVGPIVRYAKQQILAAAEAVDYGADCMPIVLRSNLDGWQSGIFTHFALDSQS